MNNSVYNRIITILTGEGINNDNKRGGKYGNVILDGVVDCGNDRDDSVSKNKNNSNNNRPFIISNNNFIGIVRRIKKKTTTVWTIINLRQTIMLCMLFFSLMVIAVSSLSDNDDYCSSEYQQQPQQQQHPQSQQQPEQQQQQEYDLFKNKINNSPNIDIGINNIGSHSDVDHDDNNLVSWGKSSIQNNEYHHSDRMEHVGDKSLKYSNLRSNIDTLLPMNDLQRLERVVNKVRKNSYNVVKHASSRNSNTSLAYDIYKCPHKPPPNYPYTWNVLNVIKNWPTNDTNVPSNIKIHQGLCIFDYRTEIDKAMIYREAELPFILRDDPKVMRTVERWNTPGYVEELLGEDTKYRVEKSTDSHFLYFRKPTSKSRKNGNNDTSTATTTAPTKTNERKGDKKKQRKKRNIEEPKGWEEPTKLVWMTYSEWLSHANITYDDNQNNNNYERDYWYYFRLIGCGTSTSCNENRSEYVFDELSFFQPRKNNIYLVDHFKQAGIHCRFGMKGVIAENHYDGSRNFIAVLGGERRYILSHPNQCLNHGLYPRGHPSARHSSVNWSNPDFVKFPQFKNLQVNEVVLQAGDVMYLPAHWFHYIVSLNLNFQCNTRSGSSDKYKSLINECGF